MYMTTRINDRVKCCYINEYVLRLHIEYKEKDRVHLTNTFS